MNNLKNIRISLLLLLLFLSNTLLYSQTTFNLSADGNQPYCPGSELNIVTSFDIDDSVNTGVSDFFIQISEGYQAGFDDLILKGSHPTISVNFDDVQGKLIFKEVSGGEMLYENLKKAVRDVVFTTNATPVTAIKKFSLSIGSANYLPLTEHYYQFISVPNITWQNAKIDAENKTYFGLQGYLATLTSLEEAQFAGEQASDAGWIGGTDEETEGVWKWATGPEAGTVFWNGEENGSTPNFAFWNNGEPNDARGDNSLGEDWAHITNPAATNVIPGSWNDLPNEGGTGLYIPRGYIIEYGGSAGDPTVNIVVTTSIYIPQITTTIDATVCESGAATISATPSDGQILWYTTQTGGTSKATGNDFTTPNLNTTTTYYATVSVGGCTNLPRTPVTVTVNQKPTITNITEDIICSGSANLAANASEGDVYWYDASGTLLKKGNNFTTPVLTTTTSYFVEANISNCVSSTRTEIIATVDNTVPKFNVAQNEYALCADIGEVELKVNPQGNYKYVWKREGVVVSGDLETLKVNTSGTYTVSAISSAGCQSNEETIMVIDSEKATITNKDVEIKDDSENNSIRVINANLGSGDYEFSLDDEFGVYKDEGFFQNIPTGIHTLFIKDKRGCGTEKYNFSILQYPKFFTPNEDGKNDLWKIDGFDKNVFTVSDIYIYNRYGMLIYKIDVGSDGWNGKYQGKDLPSNTYWFRVNLTDTNNRQIEKVGNFSLIRN